MGAAGRLLFEAADCDRFLELEVMSEFFDLSQELTVEAGATRVSKPLVKGWAPLSLAIPAAASGAALTVNKIFPRAYYPDDSRELAIRVRQLLLHDSAARHGAIATQVDNNILNMRETLDKRTVLESKPMQLGIDLHGVCNVNPPCVYCNYEELKKEEGAFANAPFTVETLDEWGDFFGCATRLVNCSIGEPFMMRNFDEIFDVFGAHGKAVEMSTNGQILTDANIGRLLGRRIELYISLDAASAETYARLRNNTFDRIIDNIRRLVKAKGGRGGLPRVYLVFMPMRANLHEVDAFVRLCAELEVDQLILRPLNILEMGRPSWERGGYTFVYERELLPLEEQIRIAGRVDVLCRRLAVPLSNQLDFGGASSALFDEAFAAGQAEAGPEEDGDDGADQAADEAAAEAAPTEPAEESPAEEPAADRPSQPLPSLGAERLPMCSEPWRTFYILRRGALACCHGGPLGPMDSYREAWNGEHIQQVRAALARGEFHTYCLHAPSCPIVRKHQGAGIMSSRDRARMASHRLLSRLFRFFFRS
jgi:MoaA/NifB/PqqE/SkfB family radical SAM enzyme